jgi:hypothetical protein
MWTEKGAGRSGGWPIAIFYCHCQWPVSALARVTEASVSTICLILPCFLILLWHQALSGLIAYPLCLLALVWLPSQVPWCHLLAGRRYLPLEVTGSGHICDISARTWTGMGLESWGLRLIEMP